MQKKKRSKSMSLTRVDILQLFFLHALVVEPNGPPLKFIEVPPRNKLGRKIFKENFENFSRLRRKVVESENLASHLFKEVVFAFWSFLRCSDH